jgi:hypothetical protein
MSLEQHVWSPSQHQSVQQVMPVPAQHPVSQHVPVKGTRGQQMLSQHDSAPGEQQVLLQKKSVEQLCLFPTEKIPNHGSPWFGTLIAAVFRPGTTS